MMATNSLYKRLIQQSQSNSLYKTLIIFRLLSLTSCSGENRVGMHTDINPVHASESITGAQEINDDSLPQEIVSHEGHLVTFSRREVGHEAIGEWMRH